MDLTNESTMSLFQELEEVEVKEEETTTNSSLLSNLINQCGIPLEEQQEKITTPSSPSNSMNSDMETHQSLIEELEEFFGSPTNIESEQGSRGLDLVTKTSVATKSPNSILEALASGEVYMPQDQDFTLTEEVLQGAVSTTCVTEDGQNVIIIVAPPSPTSTPRTRILNGFPAPPALSAHPALCEPSPASREVLRRSTSGRSHPPHLWVPTPWRRRRGRRRRTGRQPSGTVRRRRESRTPWKRSSNFSLPGTRSSGPSCPRWKPRRDC